MRYVFDVSRARDLLGWTPEVAIEDGIERTVEAVLAGASRD
jgi:nucleoside-diphosphate-sugar epimerase